MFDIQSPLTSIPKGGPDRQCGRLSFHAFEEAFRMAQKGDLDALVTAPISKKSWALADIRWPGHTEYLNQHYPKAIMSFWSEDLRVALFSHHTSLRKALDRIERNALFLYLLRLHDILLDLPGEDRHFLVAGLNPHAGEEGLMGKEEEEEIRPAIKDAQQKGLKISGPYPPDVVFRIAKGDPRAVVIALYHDQGLIPFKLVSFESGVNVSLGLPFVRTSPDHGTAFDIAGKGCAQAKSMTEAIRLAALFLPAF